MMHCRVMPALLNEMKSPGVRQNSSPTARTPSVSAKRRPVQRPTSVTVNFRDGVSLTITVLSSLSGLKSLRLRTQTHVSAAQAAPSGRSVIAAAAAPIAALFIIFPPDRGLDIGIYVGVAEPKMNETGQAFST